MIAVRSAKRVQASSTASWTVLPANPGCSAVRGCGIMRDTVYVLLNEVNKGPSTRAASLSNVALAQDDNFSYRWLASPASTLRLNSADLLRGTESDFQS